jgi:hypothetical protein
MRAIRNSGLFSFVLKNEAEGQDFIPGAGVQFRLSRDLRMVVICASFRESSIWRVGHVLSHAGCISIRVTATLSVMSGSLSLQSSRSMFVVFGLEDGGLENVGYGYVIRILTIFTLPLALTSINVLLVYACSSL